MADLPHSRQSRSETRSRMKALIAMSGGVDSSVAALLTKRQGYDCIGCTMKLYTNEDVGIQKGHTCCSLDDVADARSVANKLDMPYYVFNFSDSFREKVIDKFIACYECGRTPNPCIDCNRHLKFDKLFERAQILDCDKVVTGHYARIRKNEQGYQLLKAKNENKDQSYVLYRMTQEQLAHTLFPLGELSKDEVRQIADSRGFVNANKPDSQDICFVPDGDYVAAIKRFTGKEYPAGDFVDTAGNKLGTHKGIVGYTIGQRKGLGISAAHPLYVCAISPEKNEIVLGEEKELMSKTIILEDVNWISGKAPEDSVSCSVKIRYRHREQPCIVSPMPGNKAKVEFVQEQRAATPGQAAVMYLDDVVLGGGVIC